MNNINHFSFSVLILLVIICSGQAQDQAPEIIIENVQYLDVERGVMKKGNVAITHGKILSTNAKSSRDKTLNIIDGTGKFIIPGLIDAHIHLFQSGGLYTRPDVIDLRDHRSYDEEIMWLQNNVDDILKRYLACGITTVIDVGGPMANFEIRDRYNGSHTHPNIYLTGPLISTYQPAEFDIQDAPIIKVNSSEEARALVRKQIPFKPDFIKIWYITLPQQSAESTYDIVEATIDESHKNNLKVAVHATELNTAKLAIRAGADFLVHSVDNPVDEDFIKLLSDHNVTYIPTMIVHRKYVESLGQTFKPTAADFLYANPFALGTMFDGRHLHENKNIKQYKDYAPMLADKLKEQASQRNKNLKTLWDAGINIATGTDAGNIGSHHASSYFEEIADMKKSGLSNLDILRSSTINAAKTIDKENEIGRIDEGFVADLVLLNSNPLEDLNALQDVHAVIKGGKLIDVDTLIKTTPEILAQQQLNAYNANDIDAFLAPYSDTVKVYTYPDIFKYAGKENMRSGYTRFFEKNPNLHCELISRIVKGDTVIDKEHVTGLSDGRELQAVAIYKMKDGKIIEVRFL